MRPFSPRMFPDMVIVYPANWSSSADSGAVETAGAGVTLAASVQPVSDTAATVRREAHGTVEGTIRFTLLFAADPGVPSADVLLDWTAHAGTPLATPVRLSSLGPARPPSGLRARWTVDCEAVL